MVRILVCVVALAVNGVCASSDEYAALLSYAKEVELDHPGDEMASHQECSQNEVWIACGGCDSCAPQNCPTVCTEQCECKDGYLRHSSGDCVPEGSPECVEEKKLTWTVLPGDKCSQNEVWSNCGGCNSCAPQNCPTVCTEQCECKDGYLRHSSGDCVLEGSPECVKEAKKAKKQSIPTCETFFRCRVGCHQKCEGNQQCVDNCKTTQCGWSCVDECEILERADGHWTVSPVDGCCTAGEEGQTKFDPSLCKTVVCADGKWMRSDSTVVECGNADECTGLQGLWVPNVGQCCDGECLQDAHLCDKKSDNICVGLEGWSCKCQEDQPGCEKGIWKPSFRADDCPATCTSEEKVCVQNLLLSCDDNGNFLPSSNSRACNLPQ